jgi:citrate lyase subunit beta/citryl-CoA lyase
MRSKLFVPGSRPELFAKALASAADAISIDLEDAVAESRKAEARVWVRQFLHSDAARASSKILIVRVNPLSGPHFAADIAAITGGALDMVNLPKVESADDVRAAAAALERAEQAAGIDKPIALLANIESPRAFRCSAEIAGSHPRMAGLQLGYGDLFEPLGIARRNTANVHAVLFAGVMAAGEAGIFALDGAFADVGDPEGYRAEAEMARSLGCIGKSCIHPSQVALANDVFRPSSEEVEHALRVVEATRKAEAEGVGAYLVDGRMIDAPFARRAEAIVAAAQRGNNEYKS